MVDFVTKYGKTALITGASSGIGKAFAAKLASLGFGLILVARRIELLNSIKQELESKHPVGVYIIPKDIAKAGSGRQIYQQVKQWGLTVNLLINNAGIGSHGELDSIEIEKEMNMVDLNCRAVVELSHVFLPEMKQMQRGGMIITSSVLGVFNGPYMATYSATKAFDLAFAKALYGECKPYGVDILAVLPGPTKTDFFQANEIKRKKTFSYSTAEHVVQTSLNALGKNVFVADGLFTKLGIFSSRFMPSRLVINICKRALR